MMSAAGLPDAAPLRRCRVIVMMLALAAFSPPTFASAPANPAATAASGELLHWHVVPQTRGPWTPTDHRKFKQLAGPFKRPEDVTAACLSCHTDAAKQVKSTIHWSWSKFDPKTGRMVGKRHVFNTFCANITSNEQFCTTCHVGYGNSKPGQFTPFEKLGDNHVDCLVCHDQSGTYHKIPFTGGNPAMTRTPVRPGCGEVYGTDKPYVEPADLALIAQSVGAPKRENCGVCHFYGGGGDGVKHGDLDSSLLNPPKSLDVHMDAHGLNFTCEKCHLTSDHRMAGGHYEVDAKPTALRYMRGAMHGGNPATCRSCHGAPPPCRALAAAASPCSRARFDSHRGPVTSPAAHTPLSEVRHHSSTDIPGREGSLVSAQRTASAGSSGRSSTKRTPRSSSTPRRNSASSESSPGSTCVPTTVTLLPAAAKKSAHSRENRPAPSTCRTPGTCVRPMMLSADSDPSGTVGRAPVATTTGTPP